MNHRLIAALAESVVPVFRDAFAKALAPFSARLDALEARAPIKGERGDPGFTGEQGEKGEAGNDGAPGRDGVDGIPGEPGRDGERGLPGERGDNGEAGNDGRDGGPGDAGPAGMDGEPGEKGEAGTDGASGRDGLHGRDGLPGVQGEKGRDGIDGRDGAAGLDGRDGLGVDNLDMIHDGERTFTLRWSAGDRSDEKSFVLPVMIYRGVHKQGVAYQRGDTVTWAGAMWHCNDDTVDGPREGQKAWTLATKRGRDGKDGKDGNPGERGPDGRPGRDGGTW